MISSSRMGVQQRLRCTSYCSLLSTLNHLTNSHFCRPECLVDREELGQLDDMVQHCCETEDPNALNSGSEVFELIYHRLNFG